MPGHSVFTGHLLQALAGRAVTTDGVLTACGVMSYVYEHVSKDPHSRQTPHYGFFDGDGDFVFTGLPIGPDAAQPKEGMDQLVAVPRLSQICQKRRFLPLSPKPRNYFRIRATS